jgi:hypothetical protein
VLCLPVLVPDGGYAGEKFGKRSGNELKNMICNSHKMKQIAKYKLEMAGGIALSHPQPPHRHSGQR